MTRFQRPPTPAVELPHLARQLRGEAPAWAVLRAEDSDPSNARVLVAAFLDLARAREAAEALTTDDVEGSLREVRVAREGDHLVVVDLPLAVSEHAPADAILGLFDDAVASEVAERGPDRAGPEAH